MNKATHPIRDAKKVNELLAYLRGKSERDFMIAKMQLNTARRISDIVRLKVSDFVYPNGKLREHLTITEQKTQKEARIVLNAPLQRAIIDYIREEGLKYDDYMFKSRKGKNRPLSTTQVHRIFQDAGQALGLEHFGSHSLRKTWGYVCYKRTKNIALIMQVYNHASEKVTLRYIGITQEDMDVMYMDIRF